MFQLGTFYQLRSLLAHHGHNTLVVSEIFSPKNIIVAYEFLN